MQCAAGCVAGACDPKAESTPRNKRRCDSHVVRRWRNHFRATIDAGRSYEGLSSEQHSQWCSRIFVAASSQRRRLPYGLQFSPFIFWISFRENNIFIVLSFSPDTQLAAQLSAFKKRCLFIMKPFVCKDASPSFCMQ